MRVFSLLTIAAAAAVSRAAYCHGKPSPDARNNTFPIWEAEPTFVRKAANASAYRAGAPGFEFWVLHLYGSAYEMGHAQGTLFTEEVTYVVNNVYSYILQQVQEGINNLPPWLQKVVLQYGVELAFDLIALLTKPFTPQHFFDEIQGMADATGLSAKKILHIHLIGELTQGDCSLYGAWGEATLGSKMLAMRALDWDTSNPAVNLPAVTVYHPTEGHAFANVGFIGWIGALTGQSSARLSIHEIGVSFPDSTFGSESYAGIPFIFLLRDILQFDMSWQEAVQRVQAANRTCDLILGVGDGNQNTARAIQYSASVAVPMDDQTLRPTNTTGYTWHPRVKDVVYYGMDWDCPSYNSAMHEGIMRHYGSLTPENTIENILPIVQTGDVHAAVYDLTDQQLYVSFLATDNTTVPEPRMAYNRRFTRLNLTALFTLPQ